MTLVYMRHSQSMHIMKTILNNQHNANKRRNYFYSKGLLQVLYGYTTSMITDTGYTTTYSKENYSKLRTRVSPHLILLACSMQVATLLILRIKHCKNNVCLCHTIINHHTNYVILCSHGKSFRMMTV